MRGPSIRGARRSAPSFLNDAGVFEPCVEHGDECNKAMAGLSRASAFGW